MKIFFINFTKQIKFQKKISYKKQKSSLKLFFDINFQRRFLHVSPAFNIFSRFGWYHKILKKQSIISFIHLFATNENAC